MYAIHDEFSNCSLFPLLLSFSIGIHQKHSLIGNWILLLKFENFKSPSIIHRRDITCMTGCISWLAKCLGFNYIVSACSTTLAR